MTASCSKSNAETQHAVTPEIESFKNAGYQYDTFTTPDGREVNVIFIKHGSIALDVDGKMVYVDPVTIFGNDFSVLPKADMILITHEHHDHLDPKAVAELSTDSTVILSSKAVAEQLDKTTAEVPGRVLDSDIKGLSIRTVPAYNTTEGHLDFHPQSRGDLGFLLDIDGMKIYVAGDTEDIPEMADLKKENIHIAFLPVNQPYTMTPEQAIHAIEMISPKIVYPYHYGDTDLSPLTQKFAGTPTEVRIRPLN